MREGVRTVTRPFVASGVKRPGNVIGFRMGIRPLGGNQCDQGFGASYRSFYQNNRAGGLS